MNIYVSHLSWGTKGDSLQNLFSQYGEVSSANVITDRETGRSRGFGFVEMPNDDRRPGCDRRARRHRLRRQDHRGQCRKTEGRQACRRLRRRQPWRRLRRRLRRQQEILIFHDGIYHPCFMRLRQGSLFARSVRATGSSPEGAAYRKGAGGRRGIGRKGETAGRTGRGCQAGAPGDHTRISPESRRG